MNILVKAWYEKNPLLYLLTPFAVLYRLVITLKHFFYQIGLRKTQHFPVPVIVIGNLSVGGTGKTPLVIALARVLVANGYRPGIVSRGYGGKTKTQPVLVTADSDPAEVGDEPVLIARQTQCPLVVCVNRVAAVKTLLMHAPCTVILSDDGLQHAALGRDIEIVVVDGERRFGNGFCLPAGPLREPISRLKKVDFIVTQGQALAQEWRMQFIPDAIYNLKFPAKKLNCQAITQPIHAIAGIGNPQRFFKQLRDVNLEVIEHVFPDHYIYKPSDIEFGPEALVIMTEKDAVKCEKFADMRHWCLPIHAKCDSMFTNLLLKKLLSLSSNGAL